MRVTARTSRFATTGERVRSFTSLTLSGMTRSNDHANRLRVAIRKVAGSATTIATMNDRFSTTITTVELVSIETKKKNDEAAGSVYALLPELERNVAEPRKLLPNVLDDSAIRTAT